MLGIDIKNLNKTYVMGDKRVEALRDINLQVEPGSFVVVVGRSGSGKTTLLRVLGGLEEKTRGKVAFGLGGERQAQVGMVFQEPRLMPWLTVEENMGFALRKKPSSQVKEVVEDHLALLGLKDFAKAYPHQISGGMAQRVALGRTLCFGPDIILMDEPLGSLDAFTRHKLQGEIGRLFHQRDKTVIFVTHDVDEAVLLGHRVVVLAEGQVKADMALDLPYPPDPGSEEFFKYRQEILKAIFQQ